MAFGSPKSSSISLEELIALNDEIIALTRAGVPLELGLADWESSRSKALTKMSAQIVERLKRGESLANVLAEADLGLPSAYHTIVETGVRAGRLTAALEGVSEVTWRIVEFRKRLGLALVYPLIVFMLAYGLFVLFCLHLAPRLQATFDDFGIHLFGLYEICVSLGNHLELWAWVVPTLLFGMILWWRRSRGQWSATGDGLPVPLIWFVPRGRRIVQYQRYAQFADLLALLVENSVPLPEALVLAAKSTGDRSIVDSARAISDVTSRGLTVPNGLPGYSGFPPFLHWLITRPEEQPGLVSALRAAAEMYRRKSAEIVEWIQSTFPVMAGLVLGGGATLLYALIVFGPLMEILRRLANPET